MKDNAVNTTATAVICGPPFATPSGVLKVQPMAVLRVQRRWVISGGQDRLDYEAARTQAYVMRLTTRSKTTHVIPHSDAVDDIAAKHAAKHGLRTSATYDSKRNVMNPWHGDAFTKLQLYPQRSITHAWFPALCHLRRMSDTGTL
jgi:hypothetical protein